MAARLKVFVTSDGLTDYVVAATSRPKALAAWGVHQDLFKTGEARETQDTKLVEAAVAQPGAVLRRSAGAPDLPRAPPKGKSKGPSKAQLDRLAREQSELDDLRVRHARARDALAAKRAALEAEDARQEAAFERDLARAQARLATARAAVDRALA